jgi:hypothetical protein
MKRFLVPGALLSVLVCATIVEAGVNQKCAGEFGGCVPMTCFNLASNCGTTNTNRGSSTEEYLGHCYPGTVDCSEGQQISCTTRLSIADVMGGCTALCNSFTYTGACSNP